MATAKTDILQAFEEASEDDLALVRLKMADLEKQLDALRAVEKCLDIRLNGKVDRRKKPAAASRPTESAAAIADGVMHEKRKKVAAYLRANGAKPLQKLSEITGISMRGPGCLSVVVTHAWFHVNAEGIVTLTAQGNSSSLS